MFRGEYRYIEFFAMSRDAIGHFTIWRDDIPPLIEDAVVGYGSREKVRWELLHLWTRQVLPVKVEHANEVQARQLIGCQLLLSSEVL